MFGCGQNTPYVVVLLWIEAEWSVVGVWVRTEYIIGDSIIVD